MIKLFFQLYDVLNHIKCLEGIALVHAENGSLIRKKIQKLNDKEISYPHSVLTARNEDVTKYLSLYIKVKIRFFVKNQQKYLSWMTASLFLKYHYIAFNLKPYLRSVFNTSVNGAPFIYLINFLLFSALKR